MKRIFTYILFLASLVISACSDVLSSVEQTLEKEGCISFCATNARMLTKAGLEYEYFDVGTRYRLYGVASAAQYDWSSALLTDRNPYETDDHIIYYGEDLHFRNGTYDFYGATICSDSEIPAVTADAAPVMSLSLQGNELDDLMYSNNLKACTQKSGLLKMNFIHALSKIQVEVAKQNDSETLKFARIHGLTVMNSHQRGLLDIVEGSWSSLVTVEKRVFLDAAQQPISLGTDASMVCDASGETAHMLIFPNEDKSLVSLEVAYSTDEEGKDVRKATCNIYAPGTEDAFLFKQNHRYTLSVTIADDGVQVVTVLPTVYEWTDVPVDHYLGQPVYIGGLMWMDRNLGAVSADYYGDWYNTVGHYFQFGRNVPYILDVEKFKEYTGDGGAYSNADIKSIDFTTLTSNIYVMYYNDTNKWATGNEATTLMSEINVMARSGYYRNHNTLWDGFSADRKTELVMNAVQCIYTYDHHADPVYGSHYVKPTDTRELIRFPNDYDASLSDSQIRELYKFGYGSKNPNNETLKNPTNWTFHNNCGREYWVEPNYENDPCPKGWRLPTIEDVYTILPRKQMSWNGTEADGTTPAAANTYPVIYQSADEEVWYGNYNSKKNHVCYIMKYPGTAQAYRLRIMSHWNEDGNKRYFSVSRYGISEEDKLPNSTSGYKCLSKYLSGSAPNGSNKESTMWANPIETIYFPASGFIVPDRADVDASGNLTQAARIDLRSFGNGTVIRTSNANRFDYSGVTDGVDAFNYVQYMSTTDYQLGVQANSRRSLGDQIRCVRDITAED